MGLLDKLDSALSAKTWTAPTPAEQQSRQRTNQIYLQTARNESLIRQKEQELENLQLAARESNRTATRLNEINNQARQTNATIQRNASMRAMERYRSARHILPPSYGVAGLSTQLRGLDLAHQTERAHHVQELARERRRIQVANERERILKSEIQKLREGQQQEQAQRRRTLSMSAAPGAGTAPMAPHLRPPITTTPQQPAAVAGLAPAARFVMSRSQPNSPYEAAMEYQGSVAGLSGFTPIQSQQPLFSAAHAAYAAAQAPRSRTSSMTAAGQAALSDNRDRVIATQQQALQLAAAEIKTLRHSQAAASAREIANDVRLAQLEAEISQARVTPRNPMQFENGNVGVPRQSMQFEDDVPFGPDHSPQRGTYRTSPATSQQQQQHVIAGTPHTDYVPTPQFVNHDRFEPAAPEPINRRHSVQAPLLREPSPQANAGAYNGPFPSTSNARLSPLARPQASFAPSHAKSRSWAAARDAKGPVRFEDETFPQQRRTGRASTPAWVSPRVPSHDLEVPRTNLYPHYISPRTSPRSSPRTRPMEDDDHVPHWDQQESPLARRSTVNYTTAPSALYPASVDYLPREGSPRTRILHDPVPAGADGRFDDRLLFPDEPIARRWSADEVYDDQHGRPHGASPLARPQTTVGAAAAAGARW